MRRREFCASAAIAGLSLAAPAAAWAQKARLDFADLYEGSSVLGLKFTQRLLALKNQRISMTGFMAPPLKAESNFFVLTREPVSLCPFCSTDAEWPTDIVVIYLNRAIPPARFSDPLEVTGVLEIGSKTDPETGFVSQIRLVDAQAVRA
jgi:hypothetical protein